MKWMVLTYPKYTAQTSKYKHNVTSDYRFLYWGGGSGPARCNLEVMLVSCFLILIFELMFS